MKLLARMLHPENWIGVGLFWAVLVFSTILAWEALGGKEITTGRVLVGAVLWLLGGMVFGLVLRAQFRRRQNRAR